MICKECYVKESRITPLLNPEECLKEHTQYICGTCGRCICIEYTGKGLQRWNFPFKTAEIARLCLRTADYTMKKCCGIYEVKNNKGKAVYKIFASKEDLLSYLKKTKNKTCAGTKPVFAMNNYQEFPSTEIRKLKPQEIQKYLSEKKSVRKK